ncbi:alpha/beta fold hydrolase [Streptantibioticus cattleyicolor]|uniref:Alpha/beta hydrolase fold protein n=1 Tax=Streptantibioticus cattleyicolor (strain ATCC 35852 / DSM 46488 / JCM 4925 / NBRC 14057 / NRRL 8057) TaxID=1003195 RepID=F8JMC6_STREN|nr:alpha/beta hydrolase [Streptantibioticus cattleyicolor]AEW99227.1 alpha/beta hydrolase fold protein [Streptantibioticus cattleyicolor NRRL 8057 = DSM 46488]CCB71731.1 Predicted hydrolase or acyltransferase of alpha/beta superfamily [Streptantibioticus cattleyicolor NRRL 8057 = DSM 46488]
MNEQSTVTRPGARTTPSVPPLGRHYQVAGGRLMLHRSGTGGPSVVFLPGAGLVGLDYVNIHDRTAELTTSVLYDRAGTGWSDPAPLPRPAADVAAELRDLLRAAAVPGPYLLVGHSLGAAYARQYACAHPDEVAGLLLLDPFHEDMLARASEEVRRKNAEFSAQEPPEPTAEQLERSREVIAPLFAAWPDAVREPLVEYHLTRWRTGMDENRNVHDEVAGEMRRLTAPPDVPLIVLTAMGLDATQVALWSESVVREMNEAKRHLHAGLAASVPRGEQRILPGAGHGWPHEEAPEEVLTALRDLLRAAGR